MRRFFVVFYMVVLCIKVLAIPAKPVVKDSVLPDGSVLEIVLRGDEFCHYYETLDGEILGERCDSNRLQAIDYRLQIAERRERAMARRFVSKSAPRLAERGLAILVEFSDCSFKTTRQNFDDLLNKDGYNYNGATGSAMNYFKDASNGHYVPQFDVFGPYKLDREMVYYGQNDNEGLDMHPDQMVVDAIAKLAADSLAVVDFSDYDADNDGYIDNVFVYYAGYGENEGAPENTIWPHAWWVYGDYVEGQLIYNGKKLGSYACASELKGKSGTIMCGIGTFCHEFSHVLGLPDFYVTDYSSNHKTLGDWDIMDAGGYLNYGNTPPTYSAHERFYLGWLTPEILNKDGAFELEELQKSNKAYIITEIGEHNLEGWNPDPNIYYLLENRQKTGWDRHIPGHGMMITKTIYNEYKWHNNVPNNDKSSQGYDLIEADGMSINNSGKAGDLFPGKSKVTSYAPYEKYSIVNIEEVDRVIRFAFVCRDTTEDRDTTSVVGDCFEETFDKLVGDSSVDITDSINEYADNMGWEGCMLFCSTGMLKVGSSEYAGYAMTPIVPFGGDVKVEFEGSGHNSDAVIVFEIDGKVVGSLEVTSLNDKYAFELNGLDENWRMKISADINCFYVNELKVCKKDEVSIDEVEHIDAFVLVDGLNHHELLGVKSGVEVYCYDAVGRLLWCEECTGNSLTFEAPKGLYVLRVVDGEKVRVVKGIGNRE